jgi:multidrug efflux pump subunit AcrA (membrane-fusion protein)
MTLFSRDSQQVRVSLPEHDAATLRAAQRGGESMRAAVRIADEWVDIQLLDIGSQVRSGRAGTDVLFAAPAHHDIALGRAVDVRITLPAQEGLLEIPLQGVYADRTIYTVDNDVLRAIDVERVGVREDEDGNMSVLVRSDALQAGDPIVVSSLSRAGSGTRVRVLGAEEV